MPDLQHSRELRERRFSLGQKIAEIIGLAHKEDRSVNDEERAKIDAIEVDITDLEGRIKDAERAEEFIRDKAEPVKTPDGDYQLAGGRTSKRAPADKDEIITRRDEEYAMRAWGLRDNSPDQFLQSAKKLGWDVRTQSMGCNLRNSEDYEQMRQRFRSDGLVYRATTFQSKGTAAAGGHTVPAATASRIEEAMLYYGGLRDAATIMRTADGQSLSIPTGDDTDAFATILAENTAAGVDDLTFGQVTYGAFKLNSKMVRASIELLQDTGVDLVGYIGGALGTRLARGENRYGTTGSTATTSPRGILVDSVVGYTSTASGNDISLASLTNLYHSVDREYRGAGSGWMMSDGIVKEARLIVDSNGLPLWGMGLRAGEPDTMMNRPVHVNNRMVSSTTGSAGKLVLFGDLSKYIIREVMDMRLIRFDERYMDALQVAWLAVMRMDSALLVASTRSASKPVKHILGST